MQLGFVTAGCVSLFLSGCNGSSEEPVKPNADVADENAAIECAASSPENGSASIKRTFGPDAPPPKLKVVFSFGTPSSGDKYDLEFSHSEKTNPPTFVYNLVRTDVGLTTDYTKVKDFTYEEEDFAEPSLMAVKIHCDNFGDDFEISPVENIE